MIVITICDGSVGYFEDDVCERGYERLSFAVEQTVHKQKCISCGEQEHVSRFPYI